MLGHNLELEAMGQSSLDRFYMQVLQGKLSFEWTFSGKLLSCLCVSGHAYMIKIKCIMGDPCSEQRLMQPKPVNQTRKAPAFCLATSWAVTSWSAKSPALLHVVLPCTFALLLNKTPCCFAIYVYLFSALKNMPRNAQSRQRLRVVISSFYMWISTFPYTVCQRTVLSSMCLLGSFLRNQAAVALWVYIYGYAVPLIYLSGFFLNNTILLLLLRLHNVIWN